MRRFFEVMLGLVFVFTLHAAAQDDSAALRDRADRLEAQGEYAQAIDFVERYVAVVKGRDGENSVGYILALARLANVRGRAGDEKLSEQLFKRAIELSGSVAGVHTAVKANILTELASFYRQRGRNSEAEEFFTRAHEVGRNDPTIVSAYTGNLLNFYVTSGQYEKARRLGEHELLLLEARVGNASLELVRLLQELGRTYKHLGHLDLARQLFRRLVQIYIQSGGPSREKDAAEVLVDLGSLDISEGKYRDGEDSYRRAIEIFEKISPVPNANLARGLAALADCLEKQGRLEEAAAQYERAVGLVSSLEQLAFWWWSLGQIKGKLDDYSAAEQLYKKARSALEKTHGDQGAIAFITADLGTLYRLTGKYSLAEEELTIAIRVAKKAFGEASQTVGRMHLNLALVYSDQRQSDAAHDALSVALDILTQRRMRSEVESVGYAPMSLASDSHDTRTLVKTLFHVLTASRPRTVELTQKSFQLAQLGLQTSASGALAQLSARLASGNGELAELIRARQAKIQQWGVLNRAGSGGGVVAGASRPLPEKLGHRHHLLKLEQEIVGIDLRLLQEFPEYSEFANPRPLDVASVRELIADDEAFIVFLDTDAWSTIPAQTFIWIVTKSDMRWGHTSIGTQQLAGYVAALRCGLDSAAWDGAGGVNRCQDLLKASPRRDAYGSVVPQTLPFDLGKAHALYKSLFGQFEDLIRNKHLLIVPSGPLTQLPFHVLVTKPAIHEDLKSAAWLARQSSVSILPSANSLVLRRTRNRGAAGRPMIGFGNPLLDGNPVERPWEAQWAKLAREKQSCPQMPPQQRTAARRRSVVPMPTRSGRPDLDHLRVQMPLHDTADELCSVAKDLKLAPDDVLLGARATEAAVKKLSAEGKLASYRVLHFATHGALAGEISGGAEPGLILTPPKEQSDEDDGYLSASEVAALKLNADWVILSACNTAAGGAQGAEALSGLARSFIYAGARALLVSHWSVDSEVTVKLITSAVGAITRDAKLGRSEALRRAMLAMIEKGEPRETHPAFWAPFVVVGEGARAK